MKITPKQIILFILGVGLVSGNFLGIFPYTQTQATSPKTKQALGETSLKKASSKKQSTPTVDKKQLETEQKVMIEQLKELPKTKQTSSNSSKEASKPTSVKVEEVEGSNTIAEYRTTSQTNGENSSSQLQQTSQNTPSTSQNTSKTTSWTGSKLTKAGGVNQGPSGKETYYNLPMQGIISIMRSIGNNDEYWVREDGVKMLGEYVMVAADLSIRPRGSLIETSLGMGIVCDTGGFIYSNPTQLDIATTW